MADLRGGSLTENTRVKAELEVDHSRGVIYVHLTDLNDVTRLRQVTVLRIQGLPRTIPQLGPTCISNVLMYDISLRHCSHCSEDWYARVNWSGV